ARRAGAPGALSRPRRTRGEDASRHRRGALVILEPFGIHIGLEDDGGTIREPKIHAAPMDRVTRGRWWRGRHEREPLAPRILQGQTFLPVPVRGRVADASELGPK